MAGGDGTAACEAAALVGRGTPLGILPLGAMNLLAKDPGLPFDLDGAIANLAQGVQRRIDIGDVNGRIFGINSVLGMAARVARHREAHRARRAVRTLTRRRVSWAAPISRWRTSAAVASDWRSQAICTGTTRASRPATAPTRR